MYAELPTDEMERQYPGIKDTVNQYMQHHRNHLDPGIYSRCNKNGTCTYNFPHPIRNETTVDDYGRPLYRRRHVEDAWTVPYNPLLLMQWEGHINCEVAFTANVFLYLYKYLYKGPDRTQFALLEDDSPRDEIDDYINGRYLSCTEAAYRILGFSISHKQPGVKRLSVHEPGRNRPQYYRRDNSQSNMSDLIRYFRRPPPLATLKFTDFWEQYDVKPNDDTPLLPGQYFEVVTNGTPARIVPYSSSHRAVARIQTVRPGAGEVFYIRALLQARAATSFEDLRMVDGVLYSTYSEAARALGLFESQEEGEYALSEAIADFKSPAQLRFLFSHLILEGSPAPSLWENFSIHLSQDFATFGGLDTNAASNKALEVISKILQEHSHRLTDYGLPDPDTLSNVVEDEFAYFAASRQENLEASQAKRLLMTVEQAEVFDRLMSELDHPSDNRLYFLDGRAGRGKSFVCKALCQAARGSNRLVCIAGSTALSIREYPRGRTMHSLFKLSIESVSNISLNLIDLSDSTLANIFTPLLKVT